jgi:hypothetical protein
MTATSAIGMSPVAANHVLGRKLDSIPFSPYHLMIVGVLGSETVGELETVTEAAPEPA